MLPSVVIIMAHAITIHMIRRAVHSSSSFGDSTKELLTAGLCAFDLGCIGLEQGVLMESSGMGVWAISLFLFVMWQVLCYEKGQSPNPLPHLLKGTVQGLCCCLAMLACSLLSYRHMTNVWSLQLASQHMNRAEAIASGVCSIPWQKVQLYQMLLTELLGTALLFCLPGLILENKTLANNDSSKLVRAGLVATTVLLTVLAGMDTSGAMYNPSLASLLVGGCKGFSTGQHLLVYWVTPLVGAALGRAAFYRISRSGESLKQKTK